LLNPTSFGFVVVVVVVGGGGGGGGCNYCFFLLLLTIVQTFPDFITVVIVIDIRYKRRK